MHLRHIDPRSVDWMDAVEGGSGAGTEGRGAAGVSRRRDASSFVTASMGLGKPTLVVGLAERLRTTGAVRPRQGGR